MKSQKQIIIPGLIFIFIFSILFFVIRMSYNEKYSATKEEIKGLHEITLIHNVDILLKNRRGISQLDYSLRDKLKKQMSVTDTDILVELEKLHNQKFDDDFIDLASKEKTLSKDVLFDKYTLIIKLLQHKKNDIADKSFLFLEPDRQLAFLIYSVVRVIPKAIEDIGIVRSIGAKILSSNSIKDSDNFNLDNNMNRHYEKVEEIAYLLVKLSDDDMKSLSFLLEKVISEYNSLERTFENIKSGSYEKTQVEYFFKVTKLFDMMNDFFVTSKNLLVEKLESRKKHMESNLLLGTIFYIAMVIFTLIVMYVNQSKANQLFKEINKKKDEDKFIQKLQKILLKSSSLKDVCEISIAQIVEKCSAENGSLYIYDEKNYKLYLASTHLLDKRDIEQTLNVHDNTVGEVVLSKQFKCTTEDEEHNKYIIIPLLNVDKCIGVIKLYCNFNIDKEKIIFMNQIASVMATHIYKSKQDNETEHYLDLIDKNVLILKSDINGNIMEVSEEFCNLTGYEESELIGKNHIIFKHEDTPQSFYIELFKRVKDAITWRGDIKNIKKKGDTYWTDTIITPNFDINNNIIGYTAIYHDITNKKKVEEMSITDALTGLFNRRHFDPIFETQILISARENRKLAFVMIDIDFFKQYNDNYGHQQGDETLKSVALAIKSVMFRPDDYSFRLGGEEFSMLFFYDEESRVIEFVERLRRSVEALKIEHNGNSISKFVTISIGLKLIDTKKNQDPKSLYIETDEALYEAKKLGRNRVVVV